MLPITIKKYESSSKRIILKDCLHQTKYPYKVITVDFLQNRGEYQFSTLQKAQEKFAELVTKEEEKFLQNLKESCCK